MHRRLFLITVLSVVAARTALAHSFKIGQIAIGHVWGLPSQSN